MKHPLTDKILEQFGMIDDRCVEGERIFFDDDMRAVADWQLKQCLEFLRTTKFHERSDYFDLRYDSYANLLEDAMRPQEDN